MLSPLPPLSSTSYHLSPSAQPSSILRHVCPIFISKNRNAKALRSVDKQAVADISERVAGNSRELEKVSKNVRQHDSLLSLSELSIGGIHGENLSEVRANVVLLCIFLKVPVDDSDILNVRFLKSDKSQKKVKSHNVVVRFHSSKSVSLILAARRNFKPLSHVQVFPQLTATDRYTSNVVARPIHAVRARAGGEDRPWLQVLLVHGQSDHFSQKR